MTSLHSLNLGILAHVDAGKTTLTERFLYTAGVIDAIGSVDRGTTQTDTLALERQRGITIKSAVASFTIGDVAVNLLDTPGHPDFIAEVERVLNVLDGVILVISAVEGVQAQTRVLLRTLQRLGLPTLLFVNKIDRGGARSADLLAAIRDKLTPAIVPMGTVAALGTRDARALPYSPDDPRFTAPLAALLAEHDDAILAALVDGVDGPALTSPATLRRALAAQTHRALVYPVFFGSAMTGAGVGDLFDSIPDLLPVAHGDLAAPVSGTVFKIERDATGAKVAYVRLFAGTLRPRDRLRVGRDQQAKVTAIRVVDRGAEVERAELVAGEIGKLVGLGAVQIGDAIGTPPAAHAQHYFAPPTLETVITPRHPRDHLALRAALDQLAEQDPLINLRQDDPRHELALSLYGEVQKEVIQDTLAAQYGIAADFRTTTMRYVERPRGSGEAVEVKFIAPNPFVATVGLRIESAAPGSGIAFRLEPGVLGKMPPAFFKAVEETVTQTLRQGLYGWQVIDCVVTMFRAGYAGKHSLGHQYFNKSMSSTGEDFRLLTPLVLMDALKRAGTTVCQPIQRFDLEIPTASLTPMLRVLARLGAVPRTTEAHGAAYLLGGDIPAGQVHALQLQVPHLTSGEGVLECVFDRYDPVRGAPPIRPRTDNNPLDWREYLLRLGKRV